MEFQTGERCLENLIRKMYSGFLYLLLVTCCLYITPGYGIAVMSVDLGTEWMKVAIVSPGVPMEIALNRESQRKTPVIVAFRDNERHFGEPASTIGVRYPNKAYKYVLELLGKKIDNPLVQLFQKKFPYYKLAADDERNTVILQHPDDMSFTPEEVIAMILKHAQQIASTAADQPIKDAVITVPPFFNQAERRAVLQAADLAGIKVLQLINSNTAVALNYGVFRRKDFNETPTNILFYDMGAGSTVATIASYQVVKSKDKVFSESNPVVSIKGVGFDRTLGGLAMQLKLRNHLAESFNRQKKTSQNVFESDRAMAKLLKEAGRVKKVLSANTDHIAQVESLIGDIDFKLPVTRNEFEDICENLFKRVQQPLKMALESAGMIMDEIDQIILFGGATRIPKVQEKLLEIVHKPELGKSINTDEAAALGAAYQAAHLSKGFKVKTFLIKDANLYPIQVDFQKDIEFEDGSSGLKIVHRTLFGRNNPFPQKKIMTFNRHKKDFSFNINYGELDFLPSLELRALGSQNLSVVSLLGVQDALTKHPEEDIESKGVKAHFNLDDNGILKLDHVEFVFERKVEEEESLDKLESTLAKLGNTIGKLFSSNTEEADQKVEAEKPKTEGAKDEESETKKSEEKNIKEEGNTTKETSSESKQNDTQETTEKKGPKVITIKEHITIGNVPHDLPNYTTDQIAQSQKKLKELEDKDQEKLAREKSKNALESFILETKQKLYTEEYERASTKEEIERILNKLSEEGDWLEYESDDAATAVFKEKLSSLKSLTREIFTRVQEHKERPEALKALHNMLNISSMFLMNASKIPKEEQIFTEVELKTLDKLINETQQWSIQSEKEQVKLPLSKNPKLTVKSIAEKIAALDREVKYLLNKARFNVYKPKTTDETTKSENETKSKEANTTLPEEDTIKTESSKGPDLQEEATTEEVPQLGDSQSESTEEPTATPVSEEPEKDSHTEL